jgi:hypothetical protein
MGLYAELFQLGEDTENPSSDRVLFQTAPLCYIGWSIGLILVGSLISGFLLEFSEMIASLRKDNSLVSSILYLILISSGPLYLLAGLFLLGLGKRLEVNRKTKTIKKKVGCYGRKIKEYSYKITPTDTLEISPSRIIEDEKGNPIKMGPWLLRLTRKDGEIVLLDRHLQAKPLEEIKARLKTCLQL